MGEKMCGLDMCIEAANQGYMLCDAGIHDCYVVNNSYRCKKGVPLIDSCEYLAKGKFRRCFSFLSNIISTR